jgi:dihydrofolate reductase
MRPISLFIASSLDGFITGPNESLEWLFTDQDYGYTAFFDAIDAAIMGRKTFDLACTFEGVPYAGKAKYVFTRQPRTTDVPDVQFIAADPVEFCRQLRAKSGKKIWLVGGSDIASVLLNADLVDEIVLSIHPIILGDGIPLFKGIRQRRHWTLEKSERFSTGLIQLTYARRQ